MKKKIIIPTIAIAGVIALSFNMQSCTDSSGKGNVPRNSEPIPVRVVELKKSSGTHVIKASGQLTTDDETILGFKTSGIVSSILVKEGDFVKKGQLLLGLAGRSLRRAAITTFAPARASTRAVASPMPLLAPVTSATVPSSRSPMGGMVMQSPVARPRGGRRGRSKRTPAEWERRRRRSGCRELSCLIVVSNSGQDSTPWRSPPSGSSSDQYVRAAGVALQAT